MRAPRGIPRGRLLRLPSASSSNTCFNEAAGIPRGRPTDYLLGMQEEQCFNEAAGIPRGRRRPEHGDAVQAVASMRPRVFPAEDIHGG